MNMRAFFVITTLCSAILSANGAIAGSFSSPWEDNPYARARLIAAEYPDATRGENPVAGVQIELNPGWKTYWRVPGDAGIPPRMNWSGSENVKSVEVRWPAPHRYIDKYGMSIGYKDEIVLPLNIQPKDASAPIHLALELDYAVCKEVCLPVNSKMALDIAPQKHTGGPFKRKLQRFQKQVPISVEKQVGMKVRGLGISQNGKRVLLSFEIENSVGDQVVDVFVEGRDNLFFGTPTLIKNAGKMARVDIPVTGLKDTGALKGDTLRLTLVGKKSSTNQYWQVRTER